MSHLVNVMTEPTDKPEEDEKQIYISPINRLPSLGLVSGSTPALDNVPTSSRGLVELQALFSERRVLGTVRLDSKGNIWTKFEYHGRHEWRTQKLNNLAAMSLCNRSQQ